MPLANSFATEAEFVTYAAERNITIPVVLEEQQALLIKAIDYLLSRESEFKGSRVSAVQTMLYPRSSVIIYGFSLASDSIPQQLKNGQMEAAIFAQTDELLVNAVQGNIQRDTVGPITETYFNGGSWETVRADRVNAAIDPLLKSGAGQINLVRI